MNADKKGHPQTLINEVPTDESRSGEISVRAVVQAVMPDEPRRPKEQQESAAETDTLKATVPGSRDAVSLGSMTNWLAGDRLRPN